MVKFLGENHDIKIVMNKIINKTIGGVSCLVAFSDLQLEQPTRMLQIHPDES